MEGMEERNKEDGEREQELYGEGGVDKGNSGSI